ncbi:iron-sulfur cluster insertion protein IscA [Gammaproteobacteria bacterium]
MAITMTETAANRVKTFLEKRGKGLGLRLGVKTSGCSGLSYLLEFVDVFQESDQVFEDQGVRVYVDPKSLVYLDGTELDYSKEGLQEGFKFRNPNVKNSCGCGDSFHT